ncbi:hypothetical protein [Schaalia vaccimaxillae]|uniref:hypothetical protein n=1 Tax=Schaalia vaccimaxillae TaxID=183916 RepID=UPI0003B61519|nr:hypothetical protein [Schaalia vaccimaxillae]
MSTTANLSSVPGRPASSPSSTSPAAHPTPSSLRASLWPLIKLDLRHSWHYWAIALGIQVVNILIPVTISVVKSGEVKMFAELGVALTNWVFAWFIIFLIDGFVQATMTTPVGTLSGTGLKGQNLVGWCVSLIHMAGATVGWALLMFFGPRIPSPGLSTPATLETALGGLKNTPAEVVLHLFAAWLFWLGAIGASRAIGHSFRFHWLPGLLLTIVCAAVFMCLVITAVFYVVEGMMLGMFIASLVFLAALAPLSFILGSRGPIRAFG